MEAETKSENTAVLETNTILVTKDPYLQVTSVVSFESSFGYVVEVSPISPTRAWVRNLLKLRLIDIEKSSILRECETDKSFFFLQGLDDQTVLLLDLVEYIIFKITINNQGEKLEVPFIDVNTTCKDNPQNKIETLLVRKTGDIIVFIRKTKRFLCMKKEVSYIQVYNKNGELMHETKLQRYGKNLFDVVLAVTEYNGNLCLAAVMNTKEKQNMIVLLDSEFNPLFKYCGTTGLNFCPSSIAGTSKDQILIVDQVDHIDVINDLGRFTRSIPVETFYCEGKPYGVAIDSEEKAWIITTLDKIVCFQLI